MNLNDRLHVGNAPWNHRLSFNVVVAYEDFATGNHALGVFNRIFPGFGRAPSFTTQNVWKFDLLEIARFRELAAAEAAAADMVIISAHSPGELPQSVKRWLEMWTHRRKADPAAFVVLLDCAKTHGAADLRAEAYLQACALRAGMDFFIQRNYGPRRSHPSARALNPGENPLPPAIMKKIITGVQWRAGRN